MTINQTTMQFSIPSIDGKSVPFQPYRAAQEERDKIYKLLNAPMDISGWGLLGKIAGGALVGAMMSVVLVLLMYAF